MVGGYVWNQSLASRIKIYWVCPQRKKAVTSFCRMLPFQHYDFTVLSSFLFVADTFQYS